MPTILRFILAIFIPPLAMIDQGGERLAITTLLWFLMGPFGSLAALYFMFEDGSYDAFKARVLPGSEGTKRKRTPQEPHHEYIELADGDVLEVVDTYEEEQRRQRLSG